MQEKNQYKILLVDDEEDILEFVGYNLRKAGYAVSTCDNGKAAIDKATTEIPHLILLDVMMPEMDGIETCMEIRKITSLKDCIIVFFTARNEDYSQIAGLDSGADDYITKPIKPAVLLSKVGSLLRRHPGIIESENVLNVGDFIIDKEKYRVMKGDQVIQLARKEFELFALLASKPEKVFTRDEIFEKVWGDDVVVGERTIDVHVRKIREKTGTDNIFTIKGVGYKFSLL
jgi:two-component system, OmpR family, alkaline phosphatase synthesis response regulator PhoP